MLGRRAAAKLAGALALVVASAAARAQPCDSVLPKPGAGAPVQRPFSPDDLVRIRDIGVHDLAFPGAQTVALSPDGERAAFQIRQAVPETNSYCLAMVVLDVRPGATPRIVDQGGDLIRMTFDFRGKAGFPSGTPLPISPRWSTDGRWIAFLKRDGAAVQVWRAWTDGRASEALTHSSSDVLQFALSDTGRSLVFATQPGLDLARQRIDHEGLSGFRFDDRYSPMSSSRPFPETVVEQTIQTLDIATGAVRPATSEEKATLAAVEPSPRDARSHTGRRAWVRPAARGPVGTSNSTPRIPAG